MKHLKKFNESKKEDPNIEIINDLLINISDEYKININPMGRHYLISISPDSNYFDLSSIESIRKHTSLMSEITSFLTRVSLKMEISEFRVDLSSETKYTIKLSTGPLRKKNPFTFNGNDLVISKSDLISELSDFISDEDNIHLPEIKVEHTSMMETHLFLIFKYKDMSQDMTDDDDYIEMESHIEDMIEKVRFGRSGKLSNFTSVIGEPYFGESHDLEGFEIVIGIEYGEEDEITELHIIE